MEVAEQAGSYSAAALATILQPPPPLPQPSAACASGALPGVPGQAEVDRLLSHYEAWVQIDDAQWDAPVVATASRGGEEGQR